MIEIRAMSAGEDEKYDICGNTTVAVLIVNNIKIPLCDECVKELTHSLDEFNNTTFCRNCDNFIMSEYGLTYGGSCKKKAELDNKEISEKDAGYLYCVDSMDTCKYAENNIYKIYADDCGNDPCSDSCEGCNYSYWKYKKIPYHPSCQSEIGKTIFLTEEEAKNKCEEIMKDIRSKVKWY